MPDREVTDMAWLTAALSFGLRMSKDPQRKLGACVVGLDARSVAFGYNGLPAGIPETPENWSRPLKYEYVIHAEINAMDSARFDLREATIYCALKPCHVCMGHMLNRGIWRVIWLADPVPFVLQNQGVWEECAHRMETFEYQDDVVTAAIRRLMSPKHDNYDKGGD